MSDRIDELVRKSLREVALLAHPQKGDPSPKMLERESIRLITELATIAREAEARALIWQLTTENTQKLLNEATARAIEKEQKYREADEQEEAE